MREHCGNGLLSMRDKLLVYQELPIYEGLLTLCVGRKGWVITVFEEEQYLNLYSENVYSYI